MKRLKMPKIPTRVPVPDMPSIRIRSRKKVKGESAGDSVPPVAAESAPETQYVEQPAEAKEAGHRKVNMPKVPLPSLSKPVISKPSVPKIPMPSLSKPALRKPAVPKIPMPSLSKPSAPKLSVPKIPMPGISLPGRTKKSLPQEEQPQTELADKSAPAAYPAEPASSAAYVPAQAEDKATPKISIHKISIPKMPSLHKSKEKQPVEKPAPPAAVELDTSAIETPSAAEGEKKPKSSIYGVHIPSFRKPKEKPATAEEVEPSAPIKAPSVSTEEPAAPIETPKAKGGISGIHMPSFRKTKETPAAPAETAPAAQFEKTAAPTETAKAKAKSKMSMPKMPKAGMTVRSPKKGGTRSTGKRILAFSIEGTDIRLLSYHNNAVESWKSVSFDAHLLKMGQVADPIGLGEAIKSAIAGIETNKCYVICALPGLRSVSRIISIPNVSKKEMDTVIPREVRRTMTVSEEDNYFHWQVLPVEAAQTRVFVLAVPKEPMSLLLQSLSHAGLNPSQVDLKPLALMRAINQRDAIIANCEGNSMELVIVSDDIPVLIRSVFLGEGVVNQDYAVGRISDELGRTIVTYNEINKERPLDQDTPVYLTGAAAAGVPFALNVAALTGRTVQPLEAPVTIPADLPIAEYMVNIGLILKVV